jgi:hypothetical protein
MAKIDAEYGMLVEDKNGKAIGKIDSTIMDSWSGEPRKYVVRLAEDVSAIFFSPENIAKVTEKKVILNLAADELERT